MELVRELAVKPVTSLCDLDLLMAAADVAAFDPLLVFVDVLEGEMGETGAMGVNVSEGADGGGMLVCCVPLLRFRRRISIVCGV